MPVVRDLEIQQRLGLLTCLLHVPHDLQICNDHFQAVPIVPGVVQLGWVIELARVHTLVTGSFTGIISSKFRRILQPGIDLVARVERGRTEDELRFEFTMTDNFVATCGRLRFGGRL